jgi:putative flavoprotein involved in K+ transport
MTPTNTFDVVVVGAGQAGLAVGYYLKQLGLNFQLLDKAQHLGDSWRNRYDSLTLFTPAEYDSLPGLHFPAAKGTYPTKDDVATYLENYAKYFQLPVLLQTHVKILDSDGDFFHLESNRGKLHAHQVVIASGPFQTPFIPTVSQKLSSEMVQFHSSHYLNKTQLPLGQVLVVGAGNSGLQIAEELLKTHSVILAQGRAQPFLPQKVLGQSLFWWMQRLGVSGVSTSSWLGQRLKERDPVIGANLATLKRKGLTVVGKITEAGEKTVITASGQVITPQSVIWATGFRNDYSWLHLPVLSTKGEPIHQSGITSVAGLYFLGLSWQRTRGSALLGWVGQDAAFIAQYIAKKLESRARHRTY